MYKWLLIAVVLFSSLVDANTPASKETDIELFKARLDSIQSLSGDFQQSIVDNTGQAIQEDSTGTFTIKRPGYFLWESKEPFSQVVVGTPEETKIYDPDLEQLTIYSKGTSDPNNPANLLTGNVSSLKATFNIKHIQQSGLEQFELIPIDSGETYAKIMFEFSGNNLRSLKFWDKLDQKTDINFSKLKLNDKVSVQVFEFIAPAGTDIIRNE